MTLPVKYAVDAPTLPDGFVVVVKQECETCQTVVPALAQLAQNVRLTVYTQDEPGFPESPTAIDDTSLAVSWHHDIETVPTLIKIENGVEVNRTIGVSRSAWESFTGVDSLAPYLPACLFYTPYRADDPP